MGVASMELQLIQRSTPSKSDQNRASYSNSVTGEGNCSKDHGHEN